MLLLLQYTIIFASVLMLVALGGCFAERSGVINIGLEGIMVIGALGGALAGLGAGLLYLTGIEEWETTISSVPAMGFNGIAVAFLGGLSPLGSILSAFFIQYITTGGGNVDLTVYCSQISSLISSLIIYLCAFVWFFKYCINLWLRKSDEKKAAALKEGGEGK